MEVSLLILVFRSLFVCRSDLEYMADGLKDLGMSLLSVDALQGKYPRTSKECKELGSALITTVVGKNKEYLAGLMKELLKLESVSHIGIIPQACHILKVF
jgi:hypothetical protein